MKIGERITLQLILGLSEEKYKTLRFHDSEHESKKEKVIVETEGYDGLFGGKVTHTVWS